VNTVVIEGGRTRGFNTDGSGFLESCRETGVGLSGESVLILGAGGAAAAIAEAVLAAGARGLILANRTPARAGRMRERLRGLHPGADVRVCSAEDLPEAARAAGVLVNTTPLGMKEGDPVPFPEEVLEGRSVCDVVYRSGEQTPLVRAAHERGAKVVTGERMLLYQGVHAQRMWTGVEPDVRAISRALEGSTA
jgi:shikimate dehydrogenase